MNITNVKLIWRNLLKNASITSINIFGLSVSLAVSTLIILFLQFEYSFDTSNQNQENLYRLNTTFKYPNSPENQTAMASPMMGPYLQRESSDVEDYLRIMTHNMNFTCRANGKETTIEKSLQADSSFFSFFNYKLLHGNPEDAFDKLENILITRQISEDLFGMENPVGNSLEYTYTLASGNDTTEQFIIAAVFDDLPANSHLQFEALTTLDGRQFEGMDVGNQWHGVSTNTYLQLRSSSQKPQQVAAKFPTFLEKEMPGHDMIGLTLQAFKEIHLDSSQLAFDNNNFQKSNRKYLQILGLIALFILLISSVNFANLSTVLGMRRVREIGVRKALGANRSNVLFQFLGEAILMAVISGALSLLLIWFLCEPFLLLLGRDIDLVFSLSTFGIYIFAIIMLGVLSGLYPAIQAARFSAVETFRRLGTSISIKRPFIQRLVVLQFVLSGMLIIGSMICYQQLNFLQAKELGFQYDQVVNVNLGNGNWMHSTEMKKEISSIPGVIELSGSNAILGTFENQNGVAVRNQETNEWDTYPMEITRVEPNYFDFYKMEFIAGQAPTPVGAVSEREYVVNESFIKRVGWTDDPIGKEVVRATLGLEGKGIVVGVIKDIHHNTLRNAITPICFQASNTTSVLSVKISPSNLKTVLPQIEQKWNTYIKDRPFDYQFMDEHFASIYESEQRLSQILLIATILSILIACLGLLALSTFIIQQRTKEIGIRKVLGASAIGIVSLLSKDFLKLVFIALVIATPVAWYVMNNWLQDFAYRVEIQWWVFALAGIVSIVVAFITVSSQSLKAALTNPVDSLKNE
ncbi:MAG: FtsX-like permease family protein [Saprospiraceae bacterium]